DYELWGTNPFGYHLTSIVLHAINAALVCILARNIYRITRQAAKPSQLSLAAAVAALFFALHPLRVESVAWVTERRDVLSLLFMLLSILAYLQYLIARG